MSLIEKGKLIEHLNACLAESDGDTPITDSVIIAIRCAVEQMTEVDAVPVVHGEWIDDLIPTGVSAFGVDEMTCKEQECSVCHRKYWVGEKMDGGQMER